MKVVFLFQSFLVLTLPSKKYWKLQILSWILVNNEFTTSFIFPFTQSNDVFMTYFVCTLSVLFLYFVCALSVLCLYFVCTLSVLCLASLSDSALYILLPLDVNPKYRCRHLIQFYFPFLFRRQRSYFTVLRTNSLG